MILKPLALAVAILGAVSACANHLYVVTVSNSPPGYPGGSVYCMSVNDVMQGCVESGMYDNEGKCYRSNIFYPGPFATGYTISLGFENCAPNQVWVSQYDNQLAYSASFNKQGNFYTASMCD